MSDAVNSSTREKVVAALSPIIGLPLSAKHRAADMLVLQFGTLSFTEPVQGSSVRATQNATVGDFALHIQCPWRIEGKDGIVTGRLDLWEPIEHGAGFNWDDWNYEKSPNLQDWLFDQWMRNGSHVVRNVTADEYGGATIGFGEGFVLRLFPASSRGEDWRVFRPKTGARHFVVSGGKVELD